MATTMQHTVVPTLAEMILWFLLLGSVSAASIENIVGESELSQSNDALLMHIVPSGLTMKKTHKIFKTDLKDIVDEENNYLGLFLSNYKKGYAMKGLIFNLYDDNMRETAISLFYMLRDIKDTEEFNRVRKWASININNGMFEYAWRLVSLYNNKFGAKHTIPPYFTNPNYFFNGETITKALKAMIDRGNFNSQDAKVNQYYLTFRNGNTYLAINSNYSRWNIRNNDCKQKIDYFTEDVSLNSYYYGVQLLHPFWMNDYELDELNPRHHEHFYFKHQQLIARYYLEKSQFKDNNASRYSRCDEFYNSYLVYENGLPFPIRRDIIKGENWNKHVARITSISIAINECISRGVIFMDPGEIIKMTEDNYVKLLTKLIRANFDSTKSAKVVRSFFGLGYSQNMVDEYDPAPTLLHHPETSLREFVYWTMIQNALDYYTDYENTLEPYDISAFEDEDIIITNANFTRLATYFEYYQYNIDKIVAGFNDPIEDSRDFTVTARQKRLNQIPFMFNFTVESLYEKDVIVRLFIGPRCMSNCALLYDRFFQIDDHPVHLNVGDNLISWAPEKSLRLSFDEVYNLEKESKKKSRYNVFKFPANLLLPRGLEAGLNMTLFVMITPINDTSLYGYHPSKSTYYNSVTFESDEKPLGFPFHRLAKNFNYTSSNYKFYNITIFHDKQPVDSSGFFSQHLY